MSCAHNISYTDRGFGLAVHLVSRDVHSQTLPQYSSNIQPLPLSSCEVNCNLIIILIYLRISNLEFRALRSRSDNAEATCGYDSRRDYDDFGKG